MIKSLNPRYQSFGIHEIGCDEVGRGPLAGPVVAAAVLLPSNFKSKTIVDSKKMNESERLKAESIILKQALAWSIAEVSPQEIDEINIRNASIMAMHRALDKIHHPIDYIIVDGNFFKPYKNIPFQTVIKGDNHFLSIAAASILAKNYRDKLMEDLHLNHPEYKWNKNKGYPTKEHIDAIKNHGYTHYHRKSFQPKELNKPLSLFE